MATLSSQAKEGSVTRTIHRRFWWVPESLPDDVAPCTLPELFLGVHAGPLRPRVAPDNPPQPHCRNCVDSEGLESVQ